MHCSPCVIFLTGLSGAGKTTLASGLVKKLRARGCNPVWLDGDEIRNAFTVKGFDEEARKVHNLHVGALASLLESQGHVVVVSLIAPYDDVRKKIRDACRSFIEVYVSTSLDICRQRDAKGLYEKAIRGEISQFTGISAPYYAPAAPELIIDNGGMDREEAVKKLYRYIRKYFKSKRANE